VGFGELDVPPGRGHAEQPGTGMGALAEAAVSDELAVGEEGRELDADVGHGLPDDVAIACLELLPGDVRPEGAVLPVVIGVQLLRGAGVMPGDPTWPNRSQPRCSISTTVPPSASAANRTSSSVGVSPTSHSHSSRTAGSHATTVPHENCRPSAACS